ncbi:MAG: hypothetical protein Tsb009_03440 [Planctomycetaceae bacterium]
MNSSIHGCLFGLILVTVPSVAFAQDAKSQSESIFKSLDKNNDGILTGEEVSQSRERFFKRLLRIGDANKDGKLSKEEFLKASSREAPKVSNRSSGRTSGIFGRRPAFNADRLFQQFDKNKDGKLALAEIPEPLRRRFKPLFDRVKRESMTKKEFARLFPGGRQPVPFSRETFNRLDKNGDKKLTLEELPERIRPRFKPIFDRTDKTTLTFEDIARIQRQRFGNPQQSRQRVTAFFNRLDANNDGKISLKEAPQNFRPILERIYKRAGKSTDETLTREEFLKLVAPRRPNSDRLKKKRKRKTD